MCRLFFRWDTLTIECRDCDVVFGPATFETAPKPNPDCPACTGRKIKVPKQIPTFKTPVRYGPRE